MQQALEILERYWGFHKFRSLQEEVINSIIAQKDSLTLFPTGGGKSVCFQIPALMQPGICLVISPLVALMEDQVNSLQEKNIKAMALTGSISFVELNRKLDNCTYGNYKFLYLAPERLSQELIITRLKQMNINLIAVDEAHCISQWGHDFRPAYLKIADIREILPNVPIAGFTATAAKEVVRDIAEQLKLEHPVIHKKSFNRSNLAYEVLHAEDKLYRLTQLLDDESAIIYVRSRKATIEIANYLDKKNYKASVYHGGLKPEEKTVAYNNWMKKKTPIIVATTAFGMGIDKPDVRKVIHLNLPESIESYFQEAGRAGRDGQPAKAILITNKGDIPVLKNQFLNNLPNVAFVKLVYKKLNAYFRIAFGEGENTIHDFNFGYFCNWYKLNSQKTYNAIQLMDNCGILKMSQHYHNNTEVQFTISGKHLNIYLDENPKYAVLIRTLLRTYGGILESPVSINMALISEKTESSEKADIKILQELESMEILSLRHTQQDASILFFVPREDETTINPIATYIKQYNRTKSKKIDAVIDYVVNNTTCKQRQLLAYFGEKTTSDCGICTVCKKIEKEPERSLMNKIYKAIVKELKKGEKYSRELTTLLPYPENAVIQVLSLLCEKGILKRTKENRYKISKE